MVVRQLLITPTLEICIHQLGRVEKWFDYLMMWYGIFSMHWASASCGSVSGSGDSFTDLWCGHSCQIDTFIDSNYVSLHYQSKCSESETR